MSQDNLPFISIEYDGEEFPNGYEHSQMGYDPDRVFLSHDKGREELEEGLNIQTTNLQQFFSEMMDIELVFRYQNGRATRTRAEADEEIDEFRVAPEYSFDLGEAELNPNQEWMNSLDRVTEVVDSYGVQEFNLETPGEPAHNVENLQEDLQSQSMEIVPDIQGVAAINFYWEDDKAEIAVYNDRLQVNDSFHDMNGLIDLKRDRMNRRINYHVDRASIHDVKKDLEEEIEEVKIRNLSERILPPELEEQF